ncbi:hypothetical protein QFC22_005744 [Naganishia vaughanmartiniae]|uniref:Uncharacterized protein n=1 Tax=Naganishia vaughanmartiniae TaxID=1424756 RepID=A0ACC2WRP4_9TREE|nr:hypothetical protein QFC22_005744 [Naganishia vaughanmartiniae]
MRFVSFARNPCRMASTSGSVYTSSEYISSVSNNVSHTSSRHLASASCQQATSTSLDIQELEVLGIQTWTGKAVFAASKNAPIAFEGKQPPKQSTAAVIDLADQLIDLTLSPSPPSATTSNANLVRPRGIPRFNSPSARTAYSPSKRRDNACTQQADKAVHPFFKQWKETQGQKAGSGRQEQTREASSYSWKKPQSEGKNLVKANVANPFVSPPVSPVLSATSVQSSPIQPPPASQRPRFAPASSSSSSSSLSSISSAVTSKCRPDINKTKYQVKPTASTTKTCSQNNKSPSPKTSPLRGIAPPVRKSPNPAAEKTFKPAFHPSSKQGTTARTDESASSPPKEKSTGDSPWKWSKWGWNQQSQRSPPQQRTAQTNPKATAPIHVAKTKNASSDPADQLIMEMQQLDLEKEGAGDVVPEIDENSYEFLIASSQVTQTLAVPQSDPDEASTYESLIASSQVSQPVVLQPTSQPAVALPSNTSPAILPISHPGVYAPSKAPRRHNMFSYKTYHIGHPFYKKPPTMAYTADPEEANELLSMIKGNAIAFDMEWPFSKGRKRVVLPGGKIDMQGFSKQGKTALVQVGDDNLIVLVHLSMMKEFPSKLREIVEDPKVFKLGVNVIGDAQKLVRDYGNLYMKGVLDLSYIARAVDAANCKLGRSKIALAKLCEAYTGCELDKGPVRQSDWSKRLSQAQMDYAANDVYSTMVIYHTLMSLDREQGINVNLATLRQDLTPEIYTGVTVLQPSTGANANSATGAAKPALAGTAKSAANGVIKITPTKMRAFNFFLEGKSTLEIAQAMRTEANPLQLNTVRAYLLDVVTTAPSLEYDKQRMYDLLSEDVHPLNAQRNKACLVTLAKQLGKQIPRSPPPPPAAKSRNLVSSDIESSQEVRQATF